VTGSSDGLGKTVAIDLYLLGATVILASRSLDKCIQVQKELTSLGGGGVVDVLQLDTSDLDSVKSFASSFKAKYKRLDWLVCNAGVSLLPVLRYFSYIVK
jgi:NAD(P)-dependent dehydrogenase (short-subunit alcohol dehydrogenase family)